MKNLTLVAVFAVLLGLLGACSDNSNPTSSASQQATAVTSPLAKISLLTLPKNSAPVSMAKISDAVLITPDKGGVVSINDEYTSTNGNEVKVSMKLTFQPGTVSAPTSITISLDNAQLVADFSPSGTVFNKPALLEANVSGLDLSSVPSGAEVALFYLNGASAEKMKAESISLNKKSGSLSFKGGQIPHFSIYGFGFTK